ncbi:trimethylamine-N-oxide reductase c-type cytochrome TorC [Mannheimia haemolytica]|uniref:Trimethylamine-N-oxide reductase c-type cytochrome TorC n=1 Tax=Mannheimia haemolytica TaxID=75985 RepID=A0A378MX84_MANHA|nr:trimethylamine-N-oxide reductase c-type cytochrome TorC [Mannheimia haemolytica]
MQASREAWAELSGKYKEEGSFEKHRLEMAEREWARFAPMVQKSVRLATAMSE